jgi:hypothetical protein
MRLLAFFLPVARADRYPFLVSFAGSSTDCPARMALAFA